MVFAHHTVCQLLHSLSVGGAEILAGRLARRMQDRYRFVFVCLDEIGSLGHQLRADGFSVHLIGRKAGLDWSCPLRLARIVRDEHVDVIHAHQYTPFFYSLTARLRGPRRPIVFTEHGRHQPDFPRRKRMMVNRLLMSRRDRVVGVGSAVRDALIVNEGMPSSRVSILYNGIDVDAYTAAATRDEARQLLDVDPKTLVVIQVARLDYLKDHATALRTMARVIAKGRRARLVLVGDGPELAKIQLLADDLGITEHLQLLGTRADVARLLPGADIFLLTSISEGIPLTALEAMAAGLPVVATDVGGMREVVIDGETGSIAPAGNDEMLANHVNRLATNPVECARLGQAGRRRAKQFFDEQRMCDDYGTIYHDLVKAGS